MSYAAVLPLVLIDLSLCTVLCYAPVSGVPGAPMAPAGPPKPNLPPKKVIKPGVKMNRMSCKSPVSVTCVDCSYHPCVCRPACYPGLHWTLVPEQVVEATIWKQMSDDPILAKVRMRYLIICRVGRSLLIPILIDAPICTAG